MTLLVLTANLSDDDCQILQSGFPWLTAGERLSYITLYQLLREQAEPEDWERIERLHPEELFKRLPDCNSAPFEVRFFKQELRFFGKSKGNSVHTEINPVVLPDGPRAGLLITIVETEERWEREEAIRQALLCAQAGGRAKTEFLSRMSHDIRTPINGIIGMTDIARMVAGNPAKTADCLEKIRISSDYLLMLVNNILDLSKIEAGKMDHSPEIIRMDETVKRLEASYALQAERKNISYLIRMEQVTEPEVWGDRLWLYQILNNLLSNAFKFVPEGGQVVLRISQTKTEEENVFYEFQVEDNGSGMDPELQKRIFDPYTQGKNGGSFSAEGSGLGLSICRRLVTLMEGEIGVKSKKGMGTRFSVRLPFARVAAADSGSLANREETPFFLAGKRILLVEDNELNLEVAQYFLEQEGILLDMAYNGREAVELFEQADVGRYDAILMDVMMPEMDGLEAARRIRALEKADAASVPIIAMTANAFREDMEKCLEAGMNAHIAKPFEKEEVYSVLSKLLNRE